MKPLFIHIPRTGGNSIREMFGSHIQSRSHDNAARLKVRLTWRWEDTFKFTIIRNPWERAYSAYLLHNFERQDLHAKFQPANVSWQIDDFHRWLHSGWKEGAWFFNHATPDMITIGGELAVDAVFHFQDGIPKISKKLAKHLGIEAPRAVKMKPSLFKRRYTYRDVIVHDADIDWIGETHWVETDIYGYQY